jgi:hypothetical protein
MASRVGLLMETLNLHFDWQRPDGVRGLELAATWASLRIRVGDECVSRVFDRRSKSVRDEIYVPLYPLAEWIVWNWWALLYETEVRHRGDRQSFSSRHNLRFAGDGVGMPDMALLPLGEHVEVTWSSWGHRYQHIEFLGHGTRLLFRSELAQTFFDFVESVCLRLERENVTETWLQQGWEMVRKSLDDPEEEAFCKAAALLGKDPYALVPDDAEVIIRLSEILPPSIQDDFLLVSDWQGISDQADLLRQDLDWARHGQVDWGRLKRIRASSAPVLPQALPWQQGYALAAQVRQALGVREESSPFTDENLAGWLDLSVEDFENSVHEGTYQAPGMEALVAENETGSPAFVLKRKNRPQNRMFTFCRGLCEYLLSPGAPRLVTGVNTERQKRNRAFAAEFLAPADAIRKRLTAGEVSQEDIDDLAGDMGVSPFVVEHQIVNHRLAEVVE